MKKNVILLASALLVLSACDKTPAGNSGEASIPAGSTEVITPTKDGAITLTAHKDGEEVTILEEQVQAYVDAMYAADEEAAPTEDEKYELRQVSKKDYPDTYLGKGVDAKTFRDTGDKDKDNFEKFDLTWNALDGASGYKVFLDTDKDFSEGATTFEVTEPSVEMDNLFCDTTYFWKVETADGAHDSEIGSFKTKGHFRNISAAPAYNVRDIGGKHTRDGKRIKQGLIYRGSELIDAELQPSLGRDHGVTLDDVNKALFKDELHIGFEFDLRKDNAIGNQGNKSTLGDDVGYERLPLGSFADLWNNISAADLKKSVEIFKNATPDKAVYCHCWGGADRTGTLIFILEATLGISMLEACMDYEFTSFDNGAHERYRDRAVQNYDFPKFIKAVFECQEYAEGKPLKDICEEWMLDRGVEQEDIDALRENLLEPVPGYVAE